MTDPHAAHELAALEGEHDDEDFNAFVAAAYLRTEREARAEADGRDDEAHWQPVDCGR